MLNGQKTASSTITNNYGLYVTGVAGSTAYDIYAADTGALNYFGGKVGFGAGTPTALAQFQGRHRDGRDRADQAHYRDAACFGGSRDDRVRQ